MSINKITMDEDSEIREMIVHHTKIGRSIRTKIKRMLINLCLPDIAIERYILNYIGSQQFPFNKPIYLKKSKKTIVISVY